MYHAHSFFFNFVALFLLLLSIVFVLVRRCALPPCCSLMLLWLFWSRVLICTAVSPIPASVLFYCTAGFHQGKRLCYTLGPLPGPPSCSQPALQRVSCSQPARQPVSYSPVSCSHGGGKVYPLAQVQTSSRASAVVRMGR